MMDSAQDFEYVRMGLNNALVRELQQLKKKMSEMDENKIEFDGEYANVFVERIFLCSEGLKKIFAVMGFMDAWEENGDIPQLNPIYEEREAIDNDNSN